MSSIIAKIREKGLKKSVRMISVKMKKTEKGGKKKLSPRHEKAIQPVLNSRFDSVVIFENHFGYYNIMLQRPQHITRALSDEKTLVLYNSYYDVEYKNADRITKLNDNFFILDMYYYRSTILQWLNGQNCKKTLMVYSTDTVPFERISEYQREGFQVLYEYVDDINPELLSPPKLQMILGRHRSLIEDHRTKVVATATKLYQNVLEINQDANVCLVSNGVECAKFPASARTKDKDYIEWLKDECLKVGYYGAMASWLDYELLKALVEDVHIQLILIGIEHDSSLQESGLLDKENVRYFGKKPYDQLAGYANYFDVCIIPFVVNDITEATSPVKLFEYMSMEKPIVTTSLPECKKYDVVKIAEDTESFCRLVYEAAEDKENVTCIEKIRQCAQDNDWSAKAQKIKAFLEERIANEG